MPVCFDDLIKEPPPLKTKTAELPDGRKYTLYQLPMSAVIRANDFAMAAMENNRDLDLSEMGRIAAQAMLGRPPDPVELDQLQDRFSRSVLMSIYLEAVRFSQIDEEAVETAKND